eukprot:EG_transcript_52176
MVHERAVPPEAIVTGDGSRAATGPGSQIPTGHAGHGVVSIENCGTALRRRCADGRRNFHDSEHDVVVRQNSRCFVTESAWLNGVAYSFRISCISSMLCSD